MADAIGMTMEERGQYITLICTQAQYGHMDERVVDYVVPEGVSQTVMAKLRTDGEGKYFVPWLNGKKRPPRVTEPVAPNIDFEAFWEAYGKVGNKRVSAAKFARLSKADVDSVLEHVPLYVKATVKDDSENTDGWKPRRKNAETYLNQRHWENEVHVPEPVVRKTDRQLSEELNPYKRNR